MNAQVEKYRQAVAALNQRRWNEAWGIAQALLREGEHPGVHFVAGVAAFEMQQLRPALNHMHRATLLNPERADYAAQMARMLTQVRQNREALIFADRAMALGSNEPVTLDTIGVVYTRANEHAKALVCYQQAVALAPKVASLRYNLGTCLLYFGRSDEARAEYRETVALDPRYWRAYTSLAQLRRCTPGDNDVDLLRNALAEGGEDPDAKLYLNLAMAKEQEDLGNYVEAFRCYSDGKRVQKIARGYESAQDEALFEAIAASFRADDLPVAGHDSEEPIFVLGMPRSGTTLVDRILSSHPDVHSAGELQNFAVVLKRLTGTTTPRVVDAATLSQVQGLDWARLGREYIESTRPGTAALPRFVDKLPHNFLFAGHIARALPRAKIICLRRNPMDTCLGNFRQLFALSSPNYDYSFDLMDVGRYYLMFDRLMAHWQALFPGRILELEYEELVSAQEAKTRELLAFCGLDWNAACLQFERNEAPVATASLVQVRQPLTNAYIGRWRRYGEQMLPLARLLGVEA
ncbi:sulfotransferase [Stenotrophomonas panacihumi]|uniref:Sulfotransferase n=1 Tax=Stenotrophomonas panacihumi TaxID=676599 RepID=A0A0R0ATR9_9GAMM|nr:sulfotransferase [Stenotrophomonas panacihumi]KRG44663.1 sulfotransferase [Stenotrophomonas panacihumi]PTN54980.1 sulfotransferase family protein [Stenotrophomonas panacihumi]